MTNLSTRDPPRLRSDDPLDAQLTFDDATMLGFLVLAIVTAVVLLVTGF